MSATAGRARSVFCRSRQICILPTLIINRRSTKSEIKDLFYPSTQYILLYHLQIESLDGLSLKELEDKVPYKYKTIAKSIKQLEALGLVCLEGSRNKKLVFELSGKELWDNVSTNLIDPIKSIEYTSDVFPKVLLVESQHCRITQCLLLRMS